MTSSKIRPCHSPRRSSGGIPGRRDVPTLPSTGEGVGSASSSWCFWRHWFWEASEHTSPQALQRRRPIPTHQSRSSRLSSRRSSNSSRRQKKRSPKRRTRERLRSRTTPRCTSPFRGWVSTPHRKERPLGGCHGPGGHQAAGHKLSVTKRRHQHLYRLSPARLARHRKLQPVPQPSFYTKGRRGHPHRRQRCRLPLPGERDAHRRAQRRVGYQGGAGKAGSLVADVYRSTGRFFHFGAQLGGPFYRSRRPDRLERV